MNNVTETKTVRTATPETCTSCKREMWMISEQTITDETVTRESGYLTDRFESRFPHDLARCVREEKEKAKTIEMGWRIFNHDIRVECCLNCNHMETSNDVGFYCNNKENKGSTIQGYHDLDDLITYEGLLNLTVCNNWDGKL